ncbi:MAG: hypothetical protein ACI9CU_001283 [Polaribacter sp.]|jgi:hypothetical protein
MMVKTILNLSGILFSRLYAETKSNQPNHDVAWPLTFEPLITLTKPLLAIQLDSYYELSLQENRLILFATFNSQTSQLHMLLEHTFTIKR